MKKTIKILIPILVISLILPILVNDIQPVSAAYYGSVDFSGTVTIKTSDDPISGVTVKLLEDGVVKRTDATNGSGYYSFTWTVVMLKIYSIRIEKAGYRDQFTAAVPQSSNHVWDFEIDGRVALFLWASDVANQTIMEELGDQLVDDEGFSDILYREDETDWEDAIDDVDDLETSDSLVLIYITGHGPASTYQGQDDYLSLVAHCGASNEDTYNITSEDLADKLQDFESSNIFLLVESCNSAGFYTEYAHQGHTNDDVFAMSSAYTTPAIRWYGDNGTNFDPDDENGSAWGGAFTHFFFEGLDLDKTDSQAFTYGYNNVNDYALNALSEYDTSFNQQPQNNDEVSTTWYG